MDANAFAELVLAQIETLGRETKGELTVTEFIVKGRIDFTTNLFLSVYFNAKRGTTGFALIEAGERIWGMDYDNALNWHRHPLRKTGTHEAIPAPSISEIIGELGIVLFQLNV